jgi:hypothetical protein
VRASRWIGVLLLAATALAPRRAPAWGLAGHRMVAQQAIEILPEPLRAAFRGRAEQISDWAVEPDTVLRDRDGRKEVVKHFLDLDLYGPPPFAALPRSYRAAVARFGAEVVRERGTVPWTIDETHARLVRELRARDWMRALRTAAYGGHYVADATMPLHAVSDYDGRASGSPGIHKAVEHDLVDAHLARFVRRVRRAVHPARPLDYAPGRAFEVLIESYAAVPDLLDADHRARRLGEVGSPAYAEALDRAAGSLLAQRLTRAVQLLGAYWLSAWEEAGRPPPPRRST